MGIYKKAIDVDILGKDIEHWIVADFNLPMTLSLYNYEDANNIQTVFNWFPENPQWWITGFNPQVEYADKDVDKQVMIGSVQFPNDKMYDAFKIKTENEDIKKEYVLFDDTNKTLLIVSNWGSKAVIDFDELKNPSFMSGYIMITKTGDNDHEKNS